MRCDVTAAQLLHVLQINDSLFPVGGFAYSDGLETAVANGAVGDGRSLEEWLLHYVRQVFIPCDGQAVFCAMGADAGTLAQIDDELTAIKPAAATRASSAMLGTRLLKTIAVIRDFPEPSYRTFPVAYGFVCAHLQVSPDVALLAFAYNRLASATSAALRLMAIGQHEAQGILTRVLEAVPEAVDTILNSGRQELRCFAPLLDIQQMNHRYLYSKLFRS